MFIFKANETWKYSKAVIVISVLRTSLHTHYTPELRRSSQYIHSYFHLSFERTQTWFSGLLTHWAHPLPSVHDPIPLQHFSHSIATAPPPLVALSLRYHWWWPTYTWRWEFHISCCCGESERQHPSGAEVCTWEKSVHWFRFFFFWFSRCLFTERRWGLWWLCSLEDKKP